MPAPLQHFPYPGLLSPVHLQTTAVPPSWFCWDKQNPYHPSIPSFSWLFLSSQLHLIPSEFVFSQHCWSSTRCSQGLAGRALLMQSRDWDALVFLTSGESEKSVLLMDSSLCVSSAQPGSGSCCASVGSQAFHPSVPQLLIRGTEQILHSLPACSGPVAGMLSQAGNDFGPVQEQQRSPAVP